MILRPPVGDDAAGIAALETALFGPEAWTVGSVVTELAGPDRFAVVAVGDGDLVGYAVTMRSGEVVDLLRIGVHPSHQRAGVATGLLAAALEQAAAEGANRMLLEVSSENAAALAFYAREGFVEIDRRQRYYRDGSDALVMCRALGDTVADGGG